MWIHAMELGSVATTATKPAYFLNHHQSPFCLLPLLISGQLQICWCCQKDSSFPTSFSGNTLSNVPLQLALTALHIDNT